MPEAAAPVSASDVAALPHRVPGLAPRVLAGTGRQAPPWLAVLDSHRLRQVRRQHRLSQERLAWKAGLSRSTVARLEHEPRPLCSRQTLTLLAEALGEHPDAITPAASPGSVRPGAGMAAGGTGEMAVLPPWMCSRTFRARPDQVRRARRFLGRMLAGYPITHDMVLICSELASNAVQHSDSARPGGVFTVRAEVREDDYGWIEVEDQGGRWAMGESPNQNGRGLTIVAALADYWDIRGDDTARLACARLDWPR